MKLTQHCEKRTTAIIRERFDEIVYATGYVSLLKGRVKLDGEFTEEALSLIVYAMINQPEWFTLADHG